MISTASSPLSIRTTSTNQLPSSLGKRRNPSSSSLSTLALDCLAITLPSPSTSLAAMSTPTVLSATPSPLPSPIIFGLETQFSSSLLTAPLKPTHFLSHTHFYLEHPLFERVHFLVEEALSSMMEYDFTYFPDQCTVSSLTILTCIVSNLASNPSCSGNASIYKDQT